MKNNLKIYVQHRKNEILGGMLTADDRLSLNVMTSNLINDLARSEAEILSLSLVNRDAKKYAENEIKGGNTAYVEYEGNKKTPVKRQEHITCD